MAKIFRVILLLYTVKYIMKYIENIMLIIRNCGFEIPMNKQRVLTSQCPGLGTV